MTDPVLLMQLTGIPVETFVSEPDLARDFARRQFGAIEDLRATGFRIGEASQFGPAGFQLPLDQQANLLSQRAGLAAFLGLEQVPVPLDGLQHTGVPSLLAQLGARSGPSVKRRLVIAGAVAVGLVVVLGVVKSA